MGHKDMTVQEGPSQTGDAATVIDDAGERSLTTHSETRDISDGTRRGSAKGRRASVGAYPSSGKKRTPEDGSTADESTTGQHNVELGRRGEEAAARFLDRRGYEIVERNWSCAAGEADIVARDGEALVFVEVKTRSSTEKGFPAEAVDAAKRNRYERIAALFLKGYDVVDVQVRFDVISLVVVGPDRALIRHHINAFAAG